jgi:hypothetical protein
MDVCGWQGRGLQNRLRGAAEASWVGSIPIQTPPPFRGDDSQRHKRFFRTSLNPRGKGAVFPPGPASSAHESVASGYGRFGDAIVLLGLDPGVPLNEPRPRLTGVEPMLISNRQEILFKNGQLST